MAGRGSGTISSLTACGRADLRPVGRSVGRSDGRSVGRAGGWRLGGRSLCHMVGWFARLLDSRTDGREVGQSVGRPIGRSVGSAGEQAVGWAVGQPHRRSNRQMDSRAGRRGRGRAAWPDSQDFLAEDYWQASDHNFQFRGNSVAE